MTEKTNLWVSETFVNRSENAIFGESDPYETYYDTPGELYRAMVKEYGRCTGKMHIDTPEGPRCIGWVFVKRCMYSDARSKDDAYLQETWVTVHSQPPTKSVEYHYADL